MHEQFNQRSGIFGNNADGLAPHMKANGGMRWGIVEDGGRVRGVVRDECFEKAGGRISQGVKGVFAWGRTCGIGGGDGMGWDISGQRR